MPTAPAHPPAMPSGDNPRHEPAIVNNNLYARAREDWELWELWRTPGPRRRDGETVFPRCAHMRALYIIKRWQPRYNDAGEFVSVNRN